MILFQSVVEPVLTAVRTHIAHLVSLWAFLTGSDRDAALGKKRFLRVEVESMEIYPQHSYEASFLAPTSGFSLCLPSLLSTASSGACSIALPGTLRTQRQEQAHGARSGEDRAPG